MSPSAWCCLCRPLRRLSRLGACRPASDLAQAVWGWECQSGAGTSIVRDNSRLECAWEPLPNAAWFETMLLIFWGHVYSTISVLNCRQLRFSPQGWRVIYIAPNR
jgi:hypothetical protein